jgi:hypothetical protein
MGRFFKVTWLALVFAPALGCSLLFEPAGQKQQGNENNKRSGITQPLIEKKTSGIEVTWEVPSEPIDGFVIRYGEDKAQLTKETTILKSELREERDPQYGPVYRYTIRDVPSEAPLYVAVAAFKGDILSDFSDAMLESKRVSPAKLQ